MPFWIPSTAMVVIRRVSNSWRARSPLAATFKSQPVSASVTVSRLPVVTVRPFNTFGPRQSARAIIPTIITQALTRPEIHLGALDTRRDFTFVSDTVAGFLKAAQTAGVEGQVFNLGTRASKVRCHQKPFGTRLSAPPLAGEGL